MNTIVMKNGVTVITPNQDLTDKNADSFKSEILKQIRSVVTPMIALDLSKVKRVDSVGLGVIVSVHRELCNQKRKLIITGASDEIRQLMAMMRLDRAIEIWKKV